MEKYADKSVFFILIYVVNAYFCSILFLLLPFTPILLDIFIPLNESRPRVQMYPAYYYIENEADYYYPILIFSIVSLLTAMCVFIATDTMLIYIVQHACGLLALAGHRFRNSLNDLYSSRKDSKVDGKIYRRLCYAIKTHKRALAYLAEIEDFYSVNIFMQVGASILCLTVTMMKIATITWSMETNQYYGYVIAQVVHIFFLTAQGQFVIDSHENVYWDMYEPYWYNLQSKMQAMFVLILRRNLNPPLLTAGGLVQLNLNTFAKVVKTSVSMDQQTIEELYLKDNKFFGQLVGVWPDQGKFIKFFIRSTIFIVMIIAFIAQISRVAVFYSVDVLSDQIPYIDLGFALMLKQYNYILNEKKLRELLHNIISDRLVTRSKEEEEIFEMYFKRAMFFCSFYEVSIYSCGFMFLSMPSIPLIMNVIMPQNESRSRELIYPSYYFVDEEKYYYLITGHMLAVCFGHVFVYIACDINLIHVVHHGCALLTISGYRFKYAMDNVALCNEKYSDELMEKTYAKVSQSIDAHKKAVEYINKIDACHIHYFFILLGMIIITFTGTFIKLTSMEIGGRFFTFCTFTIGQLTHLLFLMIMGQFLIDSNEEVFKTIYDAPWYYGSSKTQSLYLLVLRKCLSPPKLTGGGLIALNLDSFVKVLKASFSYYTVFRSS
ncbi:uncharacterized protein LOC100866126 [Apis florea]|uniref:uncharacterized protein LOC100866126 n=1 Tax=Apis florea TaxID=7463 RepID=UPI0012FF2512|nr:uncharacterized protein LOC100866126 [Apis florea]